MTAEPAYCHDKIVAPPPRIPDAAQLVSRAMDAVGAKTATEFARALGLDLNSPRTVRRWLDGHNEPDYQNTMKILRAAGMLKSADGPRRETADDWGRIEELLEEVIVLLREREGDVPATRRAQEPR